MRSLVAALAGAFACLVTHPLQAHADGFAEIVGGISVPLGDSNWTKIADTSPNLGLRLGGVSREDGRFGGLGVMLQGDWTPVNLNNMGFGSANAGASYAGERGRVLADIVFLHHVGPQRLILSARAGIGVDIAHGSYSYDVLGASGGNSRTDAGLAFELGAGLWYNFGAVQVGGELAVPIANHSTQADSNSGIGFQYASWDLDVQLGVRFLTF